MKPKLIISFLLIIMVFTAFIFKSNLTTEKAVVPVSQNNGSGYFPLGAMENQIDYDHHYIDSFGMNLWHHYTGSHYDSSRGQYMPQGWSIGGSDQSDSLFADWSTCSTSVKTFLDKEAGFGMKMLLQRPKIEWLCYGQRSDYKCSTVSDDDYKWFYSFQSPGHVGQDEQDNTIYGNGQMVRYCRIPNSTNQGSWVDNPGTVVSRLKCNMQQNNNANSVFNTYYHGDDSQWDWFIKPRIRIDSNVAHNLQNPAVCRIIVISSDGQNTLKDVIIHANDFLVDGNRDYYNGRYIEEYKFLGDTNLVYHGSFGPTDGHWWSRGNSTIDTNGMSKMDIQVYWYGNCDMWIDYVRVDNEVADGLFNPNSPFYSTYNQWLQWEGDYVARYDPGHGFSPQWRFYIEEFEFNNVPCIAYVNKKLQYYSSQGHDTVDMMTCFYWRQFSDHLPQAQFEQGNWTASGSKKLDADVIDRVLIKPTGMRQFFTEIYPFTASPNPEPNEAYSILPNTFQTPSGSCLYYTMQSPAQYDQYVQHQLDAQPYPNSETGDPGWWTSAIKLANNLSVNYNVPFISMLQSHLVHFPGIENRREPSNEEIKLITNLSISYGTKGIIYFWWGGADDCTPSGTCIGFTNANNTKRITNYYGEPKWDSLIAIHKTVTKWMPYLLSFDNTQTKSYIFYNDAERANLINDTYFADVVSYKYSAPAGCSQDDPGIANPTNMYWECKDQRFLQVATFRRNQRDLNNYFMIVNRRCAPIQSNHNDGIRFVRIQFNQNTGFQNYNTWNIIDIQDPKKVVAQYTMGQTGYMDLGNFDPGQGRIYMITPVMVTGGTLAADENLSNVEFTCLDTVYGNGHNIKFTGNQNTISFSDSGSIVMYGGTFQTDSASHGPQQTKNKFQAAVGGHKWGGLQFTGCNIKIYNSQISDISSSVGGNYALNCINCPLIDLRYNLINLNSDTTGGISIAYTGTILSSSSNYVMYNTLNLNNSYSRAVQVQGFGGNILGTYITGNTINSNGAATGILISTVTGGVIKNNTISGCGTGINTIFSSCDICGNTIASTINNSIGIQATDQSIINMQPTDGDWLGGINSITNGKGNSINLSLDNSVFGLEGGYNIFNVDTSGSSSPYHIYGSFWESDYNNYTKATNNCFMISGNTISDPLLPLNNVMDQYSNNINLNFNPYNCNTMVPNGSDIVDIFNGVYDTIPTSSQGGGKEGMFVITPKQLYDSICISFRHRSYVNAKTKCMQLLNTYPDSSQSIAALRILYLASILTDTSSASNSALKTLYESLILNHGNNSALVDICNYLVQKCKVLLHQYSSALTGFQSIINNNAYNYEGLLARWDFMATSLLMNGGGGGEPTYDDGFSILDLQADEATDDNLGPKDKSPFTKDQRKIITGAVNKTFETNKNKDEEKIKYLTKQVKNGDDKSKKELNKMNSLKDVIKSEQPKNIIEHLKIVNNDIKKVFGGKSVNISKDKGNSMPQVFSISQNFPNPFNPTTTIKYALPKDVKVTIKIYDILGKLVTTLVNGEQKKAGYYEAQFDGTNFASGVYFYRIEAGDFVQSKKMVLVK